MYQKQYESSYEINRTNIIRQLIQEVDNGSGKNALDIGCNKGYYSEYLLDCGYKTTGLDMYKDAINAAEKSCSQHDDVIFKLVNLEKYDFKDLGEKFDLVLCLELIEHINNREELIQQIVDRMKKKGKLIISTPNILSIEGFRGRLRTGKKYNAWDPSHVKIFNSFEFSRFLKKTQKLKIIKTTGYWYSSGKWYHFKKYPDLDIHFGLPIKYTSMPLINMFGFNIIIVAERI